MSQSSRKADIFQRAQLRPSQLRTVAGRRFADAECLRKSGQNERANGAMYLGGFVIECLLKAKMLEKYPWLGSAGTPKDLTAREQRIWSLCYRSHALDELLGYLPEALERLQTVNPQKGQKLTQMLQAVCGEWTVFGRYSPRTATIAEATRFLRRIRELKIWLT